MSGMIKSASIAAAVAVAALLASNMAASAQTYEPDADAPVARTRPLHRARHVEAYRPLTVGGARQADAYGNGYAPAYNPYSGPAAVVTAPIAFGATLASLPFRAINSVFPAQGNTPLVVVGAPVHFAGQLVQAPFAIAQAPFGGPGPFTTVDY